MVRFKDMTFCPFWEECKDGEKCDRALTDRVREQASEWWSGFMSDDPAPIACYTERPRCFTGQLNKRPDVACPDCECELIDGVALINKLTGIPDFIGDDYVCTVSPSGEAELTGCLKCPLCGFSVHK